MNTESVFFNDFDYAVLIAVKYREDSIEIAQWLTENIRLRDFQELYAKYWPNDGEWHPGASTVLWCVAFKNEEDALAFKLRWV